MKETFAKNAEELSEGIREENTYTWKILSVKDIKEGLDEVVKNLDMNQTLYALMIDCLITARSGSIRMKTKSAS